MVLAAQPFPPKLVPRLTLWPPALDFVDVVAKVVYNECHTLDFSSMRAAMRGVSLEVGNLVVTMSLLIDFWFDWLVLWIYKVWCGFQYSNYLLNAYCRCSQITLHFCDRQLVDNLKTSCQTIHITFWFLKHILPTKMRPRIGGLFPNLLLMLKHTRNGQMQRQ